MITISNFSKKIGKIEVLSNINYSFEPGMIYGLSGRNGSGKTMLLRALSGLILPTSGKVEINEKILHKDISFPESVGLIIENMEMLPQLTGFENLKMISKIRKVASDEDIHFTLKRVGLDSAGNTRVKKYSLGMKQRLNIAQAIFEKPDLLLLDEPLNAIDQAGAISMRKLLIEERNRGAIIVIASHLNEDLIDLCDNIIRIDEGRIV